MRQILEKSSTFRDQPETITCHQTAMAELSKVKLNWGEALYVHVHVAQNSLDKIMEKDWQNWQICHLKQNQLPH